MQTSLLTIVCIWNAFNYINKLTNNISGQQQNAKGPKFSHFVKTSWHVTCSVRTLSSSLDVPQMYVRIRFPDTGQIHNWDTSTSGSQWFVSVWINLSSSFLYQHISHLKFKIEARSLTTIYTAVHVYTRVWHTILLLLNRNLTRLSNFSCQVLHSAQHQCSCVIGWTSERPLTFGSHPYIHVSKIQSHR